MKRSGTLVLAAVAVLVTAGVWWLSSVLDDRSAPSLPPSPNESPGRGSDGSSVLEKTSGERPGERLTSSDGGSTTSTAGAAVDLAEEEATVHGTVVDGRNQPIPGAEVSAIRGVAVGFDAFDPVTRREERQVAKAHCDREGRFELRIPSGRPLDLRASSPGFAMTILSDFYAGQSATLVLRHAATLSGVVRRKEGGAPVANVRMILVAVAQSAPEGAQSAPEWEGRTDESGRYLAQGLRPGSIHLLVYPEKQSETQIALVLGEGETRALDVTVSPGALVTGEVKDAETGQPIAQAEVSPDSFLFKIARTDESGRYELSGVSAESPTARVCARAPGYGKYEVGLQTVEGAVLRADFELVRGRVVSGRVVSRDGQPIADAYVAAVASWADESVMREDWVSVRTRADGRFRLADVRTDVVHGVLVRKERFATAIAGWIGLGVIDEADLGDVVLAPGASLAGMVATSAGDPIQAALVVLSPAGCESLDSCPLEREARTDALGTFCFADLAAGKQNLRVEIEGIPSTSKQAWTVELAEGEAKLGFKIVLGEGRSIAGRVVDPAGLGIESAEVELTSSAPEIQTTASVRSRADGSFQFNGLEPGAYNLTAGFRDVYGTPDDRYSLIDAHAANVDAGASSVVLRLRRAAEITGHVRTSSGDAVVSARVAAVDAEGHTVDGEDVDRRGSFRLRVPAEDVVELRVWITTPESLQLGKSPTDGGALPQAVRAGVRGGDQDVVLVVKP